MPMRRTVLFLAGAALIAAVSGARAQETTLLRFAFGAPPQVHYNVQLFTPWAEQVMADSGGTLEIQMFGAGSLGREGEMIDVVQSGAADIALEIPTYYPGRFPLADVAALPMLVTDGAAASRALWTLYEEGMFGSTFDGMKVLALSTPPAAMLMTTETEVALPADTAGLRIAGGGRLRGDQITAMGAAPVDVRISELYQALDRGVVNGAISFYTAVPPFRLNEVASHYLEVPLGGSLMLVFMDQARFDSLPEAARNAIDAHSGAALSAAFGEVWDRAAETGRGMITGSGGEMRALDAAQQEAWAATLEPIVAAWGSETAGGESIVDRLRTLLAE